MRKTIFRNYLCQNLKRYQETCCRGLSKYSNNNYFSTDLDGETDFFFSLISSGHIQLIEALVHRRPGLGFKMALNWRESLVNRRMLFIRDKGKKAHRPMSHYVHP